MLFLGHFSFDETGNDRTNRHGYFTCMTDAENVDRAVENFKSLIEKNKAGDEFFSQITAVYIEDIFEIKKAPETALILRIQSAEGEFPESMTRSLPNVESDGIECYGWSPDIRKIKAAEPDEVLEMSPFLTFE